MASQQLTGRAASRARRQMQVSGKSKASTTSSSVAPVTTPPPAVRQTGAISAPARQASRARREAMSQRGKAGASSTDRQRTEAEVRARSAATKNPEKGGCGCGGKCCDEAKGNQSPPLSRPPVTAKKMAKKSSVTTANTGRLLARARRSAMSSRGKTGADAHRKGTSSASLARQANPDISSRDLARAVRDQRSRDGAKSGSNAASGRRQRPRNAAEAKKISGTDVGHSDKLTGDESGLCNTGITGTEYLGSEIFDKYCQGEQPRAPQKVENSSTLSGALVTSGGKVGGSTLITGTSKGGCRDVTGSEYLGREHFSQLCETTPRAQPAKVSQSQTNRGIVVSGPRSTRSENVTGNEKGTCKAVTGTPYAGFEQTKTYCSTEQRQNIRARTAKPTNTRSEISGIQPGLGGKQMTGAESGACQPVSGTPYVGEKDKKDVCGSVPAVPSDADFPMPLGVTTMAGGETQTLPASAVTGSGYEGEGLMTGAFAMGKGKVTGTEQFRFGDRASEAIAPTTQPVDTSVSTRVTGEGIDTGLRITGDDWDRGDRVTGTEGSSAVQRNPSRRGATSAMPQVEGKRSPQRERPSANVTGGSGGSEGAAVTVSGGARG